MTPQNMILVNSQDIQGYVYILQSGQYFRSQAAHDRVTEHDGHVHTTNWQVIIFQTETQNRASDTNKVFEFVIVKDPFELRPAAAMIWTAAPQSTDATDEIIPIVLASVNLEFGCKIRRKGSRTYNRRSKRGGCATWGMNKSEPKNRAGTRGTENHQLDRSYSGAKCKT
jgi:hypothetical protein